MSEEVVDYSTCTLAELRDVSSHIDREQFPERASEVDAEIRRREALPIDQQESISFIGGLRSGFSLYFAKTATWPLVELSFSTAVLSINPSAITGMRALTFSRQEIESIKEHHHFFARGFQFIHQRRDYPDVILFLSLQAGPVSQALRKRRWPLPPIA